MPAQIPSIARRSARALLLDEDQRVVLIKRTKPDEPPYWTTPGGGVEAGDRSVVDALDREFREELGAVAVIGGLVLRISAETEQGIAVQEIFVARLVTMDEAARSGAEWTDLSRGGYEVVRVPIEQVGEIDLKPQELKDYVTRNASVLLTEALS